jgi:hypothetical protein
MGSERGDRRSPGKGRCRAHQSTRRQTADDEIAGQAPAYLLLLAPPPSPGGRSSGGSLSAVAPIRIRPQLVPKNFRLGVPSRLPEDGVDRRSGAVVRVRPQVAVGVQRLRRGRMPEPHLDGRHALSEPDQQRDVVAPQGARLEAGLPAGDRSCRDEERGAAGRQLA